MDKQVRDNLNRLLGSLKEVTRRMHELDPYCVKVSLFLCQSKACMKAKSEIEAFELLLKESDDGKETQAPSKGS